MCHLPFLPLNFMVTLLLLFLVIYLIKDNKFLHDCFLLIRLVGEQLFRNTTPLFLLFLFSWQHKKEKILPNF